MMNKRNPYQIFNLIIDMPLDHAKKTMLLIYLRFSDQKTGKYSYPGDSRVAQLMQLQLRQMKTIQKALLDKGYLRQMRDEEGKKLRSGYNLIYELVIPGFDQGQGQQGQGQEVESPELDDLFRPWTAEETIAFFKGLKTDQLAGMPKHEFLRYGKEAGFLEEDVLYIWNEPAEKYGLLSQKKR